LLFCGGVGVVACFCVVGPRVCVVGAAVICGVVVCGVVCVVCVVCCGACAAGGGVMFCCLWCCLR